MSRPAPRSSRPWDLARHQGLAGLALRNVAVKIGLRPPSLYWYFDSKHAVYDAMFAQANRQLLARLAEQRWPTAPPSTVAPPGAHLCRVQHRGRRPLVAGLMAQQTANDPGGDRWLRLVDQAVDMFVDHFLSHPASNQEALTDDPDA